MSLPHEITRIATTYLYDVTSSSMKLKISNYIIGNQSLYCTFLPGPKDTKRTLHVKRPLPPNGSLCLFVLLFQGRVYLLVDMVKVKVVDIEMIIHTSGLLAEDTNSG